MGPELPGRLAGRASGSHRPVRAHRARPARRAALGLCAAALVLVSCAPPQNPGGGTTSDPPQVTPSPSPTPSLLKFTVFFGGSREYFPCGEQFDANGIRGGRGSSLGEGHKTPYKVGDVIFACGDLDVDGTVVTLRQSQAPKRVVSMTLPVPTTPANPNRPPNALYQFDIDDLGQWSWEATVPGRANPVTGTLQVNVRSQPKAYGVGFDMGTPGFNDHIPLYQDFILSGFVPNAVIPLDVYRLTAHCESNDQADPCGTGSTEGNFSRWDFAYSTTVDASVRGDGQGHFRRPSLGAGRYCFFLPAGPTPRTQEECEQHAFEVL